ncbi:MULTISPECIES: glycoside hydrolase family 65 protein [Trichocoleus]|uniref:Glycoside hydrolase family 65 protein n=1 Tax=Trichocoleus desertorum GB2-A4 TaxID=2933944 RepID=A0ABV0JH02_9CYAN|nr:glycoside hydrolase family 65 protein [Trichocoleus sp. FACHB-46]MBD1864995.1 glycoside hydrolase family 65 protein [Trichocoleus sp. FACHB-46]
MLHHEPLIPPRYIYPPEPWRWVEKQFYPKLLVQMETLFSTANGYLGMRGVFEEGSPIGQNGTFINGFYESWPIVYAEEAYGFARTGQTIVNATDSKIIRLYVDDEPFYLPTANLLKFERSLDMQNGTLDREVLWQTPSGKQVSIRSRRLVSFEHRHLAAISYEVTILNAKAPIVISSEMHYDASARASEGDPRLAKGFKERVLLPEHYWVKDRRIILSHITRNSRMTLACGVDHEFETKSPYSYESQCSEDDGKVVFSVDAQPGVPIRLVKYMTYHTSDHFPAQELCERAERTLDRAITHGFDNLLVSQRQYLDDFWDRSDLKIEGDPHAPSDTIELMQQVLRFNLFHVFQASARSEGGGVPAKGLTSHAYEGNYFWDMEIYLQPFLTYTSPRIAKNLLLFRYSILDKARQRAREVNQDGALFPWRTINGEEASAYYAAGTAQYHINADIIYALKKYVDITGDDEFLLNEGAEMLVETARMWYSLGFFSKRVAGQFCIHGVTGPDEYNAVVNNNTYTNLMARENLWYAASTVEMLRDRHPDWFIALVDKTKLKLSEVKNWRKAADNMYLPFDERLKIHIQHDTFLDEKVWDFENTPPDKYPLLLHFHPLVIYRHQVIKQADIVLAMFLLGDKFSPEQKRHNFDYYDPLTTGDSSLSVSIQSIVSAEIGYLEQATEYAKYAVLMDLGDVAGNVKDGCHIAAMGGTWMVAVYGFAGMRDYNGHLSFHPKLPEIVKRLRFPLTIQGQRLEVDIQGTTATYLLQQGTQLAISHQGKDIQLLEGIPVTVELKPVLELKGELIKSSWPSDPTFNPNKQDD